LNDFSEDAGNSSKNIEYKALSPVKNRANMHQERNYEELNLLDCFKQPAFDSPEPTKSVRSKRSSLKKPYEEDKYAIDQESINGASYEDGIIETVVLDSSKLRSQKRGLPIEEKSCEKEETPK
jgi:hypothetical protein